MKKGEKIGSKTAVDNILMGDMMSRMNGCKTTRCGS